MSHEVLEKLIENNPLAARDRSVVDEALFAIGVIRHQGVSGAEYSLSSPYERHMRVKSQTDIRALDAQNDL